MARLRLLGLENVQNAGAGQLGGIAAQGQVQGHPGQVAPLGIAVDGLGGVRQGPVQGGTEVVIQRLVVLARLLAGGKPFRPLDLNTKYYNVVKD